MDAGGAGSKAWKWPVCLSWFLSLEVICSPSSLPDEIRVLWFDPVSCSGDLGYANRSVWAVLWAGTWHRIEKPQEGNDG